MLKTKEHLVPTTGWRTSDAQRLAEQPFMGEVQASLQAKRNGTSFKSKRGPESDQAPLPPQDQSFDRRVGHFTVLSEGPLEADRELARIT